MLTLRASSISFCVRLRTKISLPRQNRVAICPSATGARSKSTGAPAAIVAASGSIELTSGQITAAVPTAATAPVAMYRKSRRVGSAVVVATDQHPRLGGPNRPLRRSIAAESSGITRTPHRNGLAGGLFGMAPICCPYLRHGNGRGAKSLSAKTVCQPDGRLRRPSRSRWAHRITRAMATAARPAASPIQIPLPRSGVRKASATPSGAPTSQ